MDIKVTIIMPSLNVASYIEECLKSVVSQTLQEIEILCVDAGSTDGTLEIIEQFANQNSKIRRIQSDKKSYGYQVNIGIKEARGRYIGIVETDDLIVNNMFEKLYNIAVRYDLDYVKGKFNSFVSVKDNEKYLWESSGLAEHKELYDKVICPCNIPYIYLKDANVGSGIYKKEFLTKNNIWFNESQGAAYQDVGFLQQVISCSRKALYCEQAFYIYRADRGESSVKSPKGLNYVRGEFERILSDKELCNKIGSKEGFYTRMLSCFLGELKKVLPLVSFDRNSQFVSDSFRWYVEELKNNYQCSILKKDKKEFEYILSDEERYFECFQKRTEQITNNRNSMIKIIKNQNSIIFGAGIKGAFALNYMLSHGCKPMAFCDNNEEKLTDQSLTIPVLPLHICKKNFQNAFYIIANKMHAQEIELQLKNEGIDSKKIIIFE